MRYLVALLMLAPFMILARPAGPALADHACGHFEGPEVTAAEIESAALQGCAIDALGVTVINDLSLAGVTFPQSVDFSVSTFLNDADFSNATFKDAANFSSAEFKGPAHFNGTTFLGRLDLGLPQFEGSVSFLAATFGDAYFGSATFRENANFDFATFEGTADFPLAHFHKQASLIGARFRDVAVFTGARFDGDANFGIRTPHLDLRDSTFTEVLKFSDARNFENDSTPVTNLGSVSFDGASFGMRMTLIDGISFAEISPPGSISGATNLTWNDVKDFLAPGDRVEILRAWESFFASGGQPTSARQIRTIIRRGELAPIIRWLVRTGLVISAAYFVRYYYAFRQSPSTYDVRFRVKTFAFSLAVMAPIAKAWAYDWDHQFPIERVSIATSIQSLLGWLLLAAGSALAVIWFTA